MRKKLLGILLGAVMAVSLAACGGSSGGAKIESTDAAPAADAASTTEAPAAENGCGGTITLAGLSLVATLGICTSFLAKKRED